METLKFTIEDAQIAELLGKQNYSSKEAAIFELVKNCYDSGSLLCNVFIENDCIKIEDFGCGMNEEDIKEHWMHIGKSIKANLNVFEDRILTGSKGVGRFALARLGSQVRVSTKKEFDDFFIWETNWEISSLERKLPTFKKGTIIEIFGLRDHWKKKDTLNLEDFLSRVIKSEKMEINLYFEGELISKIENVFLENIVGENYFTKINLAYDSLNTVLEVKIESDEFEDDVKEFIGDCSGTYYFKKFSMVDELHKKFSDLDLLLRDLGDFNAELYFVFNSSRIDKEKFKYKYTNLKTPVTGIVLYRNDFSIVSFDGVKDWLNLSNRARKSPAAATHPTGSWRVRTNQLFGWVNIDKNENKYIRDISNRQGIEEDEYFKIFCEIINFGISRFEKYRQSIIRKIDEPSRLIDNKTQEKELVKSFLKRPQDVVRMSQKEVISLATEIKDIQKEAKEQSKARAESERQHKYDVRILNVLATQGLRASALGHELYNKRSALASGFQDIEEALKEYGLWDTLNSEEYTQLDFMNVPGILSELEEVNMKLITFIDVILKKIEKKNFKSSFESLEKIINGIFKSWKSQYNWVDFKLSLIGEMPQTYNITNDVIEVVFDNLILNSIQHNNLKNQLSINVTVEFNGVNLDFKYSDNGQGLSEKYKDDPLRILDVHESSREDGHGLGMWILNNTLNMYGGKVTEINSDDGFKIQFYLKG